MWSNDERLRDGPGRYEMRSIGAGLTVDGATVAIPANPNRVSLIVTGVFTGGATGDGVAVDAVTNGTLTPVASVSLEAPTTCVRFCDAGDGIWRAMVLTALNAGAASVRASEVVWHPKDIR